jgi:RNA polymerase sigma-70 factor (ECF subfamily)
MPYRQALVLHHLIGLPVAEVATELGIPEGTVKTRLARGRRRLAEALGEPSGNGEHSEKGHQHA